MLRDEYIQVGNMDVFHESVTIASACNMFMSKRFLKTNTIGLIRSGGYTGYINYSKNAIM